MFDRAVHANIVAVYDVGTLGRDVFVAMDLVEGTPLQTWQEGREWRDVLDAYLDAGKGLVAAHEQGLVHRDIKAGNVLIDERGHATVIDFGLAAVDSEEPEASHAALTEAITDDEPLGAVEAAARFRFYVHSINGNP